MAISIPHSFTGGTSAVASQVNANFTEVAAKALDKTGDTLTGNILASAGVTIDGVDLSARMPGDGQLVFPASQNASSDANTLDDYEEGTYSPSWTGTGDPAIGNGVLAGRYIKIGKQVTVHIRFAPGSTTTFGGGSWTFTVPFTAETATGHWFLGMVVGIDTGTATFMGAPAVFAGGNTMQILGLGTWGTTFPFTWVDGDGFNLSVTYTASA